MQYFSSFSFFQYPQHSFTKCRAKSIHTPKDDIHAVGHRLAHIGEEALSTILLSLARGGKQVSVRNSLDPKDSLLIIKQITISSRWSPPERQSVAAALLDELSWSPGASQPKLPSWKLLVTRDRTGKTTADLSRTKLDYLNDPSSG